MGDLVKLTDQIDQLLAQNTVAQGRGGESYSDGWDDALLEARALAKAHAKVQREVVEGLAATFVAQTKEINDARQELSRGVLDLLVARPEQTLAEIVTEVVKEFRRTAIVGEEHVCACDCKSAEELTEVRGSTEDAINSLKGLA